MIPLFVTYYFDWVFFFFLNYLAYRFSADSKALCQGWIQNWVPPLSSFSLLSIFPLFLSNTYALLNISFPSLAFYHFLFKWDSFQSPTITYCHSCINIRVLTFFLYLMIVCPWCTEKSWNWKKSCELLVITWSHWKRVRKNPNNGRSNTFPKSESWPQNWRKPKPELSLLKDLFKNYRRKSIDWKVRTSFLSLFGLIFRSCH